MNDPTLGRAVCSCYGHMITVEAYDAEWLEKSHPEARTVDINFWTQGSSWTRIPWTHRLKHAWGWLRGKPDTPDGALLERRELRKLISALQRAELMTWPSPDPYERPEVEQA